MSVKTKRCINRIMLYDPTNNQYFHRYDQNNMTWNDEREDSVGIRKRCKSIVIRDSTTLITMHHHRGIWPAFVEQLPTTSRNPFDTSAYTISLLHRDQRKKWW